MPDCIFCKIAKKEIESDFIYETDNIFVIKDIHPKAPVHLLLITKEHVENLNTLQDKNLAFDLIWGVKDVAKKLGIKDYKTVIHTGPGAGQEIFHLHVHILADKMNN
jgi:histidine triad (HIT) family protein